MDSFLQRLLQAIPAAAANPLALVAYLIAAAALFGLAWRGKRHAQLLAALPNIPPEQRAEVLRDEMGVRDVEPEIWLRSRLQSNLLAAFIVACLTFVVVVCVAVWSVSKREEPPVPHDAAADRVNIQRFARDLKNPDPTIRRQALEALVPYGREAALEIVKEVDEAGSAAMGNMLGTALGGSFQETVRSVQALYGFTESAADCLAAIGTPAVTPILDQLAVESAAAERLQAISQQQQQRQPRGKTNDGAQAGLALDAMEQFITMNVAMGVYTKALMRIGPPAVPQLLDALASPRMLVRAASAYVLTKLPNGTEQAVARLRQLASTSSGARRDELLALIRQLEARR